MSAYKIYKVNKVGLGVITCNRKDFYLKCIESLEQCSSVIDELVTVNDGKSYGSGLDHSTKVGGHLIQHDTNKGVGVSKNDAMQYLLDKGCEHIFLIEDDIIVKDKNVFDKYITTAQTSGIWHLMFGYHGPANKGNQSYGQPQPRLVIDYDNDTKVALNRHCVGAFCYYHKNLLDDVGLMDDQYVNAWEHLDHSYMLVKKGYIPAYWWWPDVANSYDYLDEVACSEDNSSIRWEDAENNIPKKDWQENIQKGAEHFRLKHGYIPVTVPDSSPEEIVQNLKAISKKYKGETCTT